jgi:hypothetical protein
MEKEAEQLKLNALNIRSILKGGKKKLKKITFKRRNLDRVTVARKRRRTKEKILENSKRMTKNIGASAKNIASKVVASKPGNFLGLLLVGIAVNNVENIVKFFRGDTFEKFMNGLKGIGKFFTGMFDGFMGFFKPKKDIEIPKELNDSNAEKLNEVNKELEGIKTETDKLNEFAKSAKSRYDEFKGKIKNENQNLEKNLNVIKSKSPNSELGSSIVTGELFKDNPFGGKTFAESMNVLGGGNNINIEPLNKEVTDLSMKKKTKTKTVFIRQPVIVGEK